MTTLTIELSLEDVSTEELNKTISQMKDIAEGSNSTQLSQVIGLEAAIFLLKEAKRRALSKTS
jgi:hypothetical protein